MKENLDNRFLITYTNSFEFENRIFSFRRKVLFDITNTPKLVNQVDNNKCLGYWINRKFLSLSKIKLLITNKKITVDLSDLQWNQQINLDLVFNL